MMQQQRQQEHQEHHQTEKQPFFKPSSSSQSQSRQDSFFINIERDQQTSTSSAASLFTENGTAQSLAGSEGSMHFSKPLQVSDQFLQNTSEMTKEFHTSIAQHENETIEIQNQDKMNALHSRLHQEADKIRRWKVQMEIDVRQKERGLSDAQQTIESQRKSLLELQLQNENLSVRLQEEIENRIDISQKIVSTREMCNLVKDYAGKLESKLVESEHVREEIQDHGQKQLEDMKVLEMKFQDLSLAQCNQVNELKSELQKEKIKLTEAEKTMGDKIAGVEKECEALQCICDKKDQTISDLQADIKKMSRQIAVLHQEKECLQESLNQANEEVVANQQLLAKIKSELKETTSYKNKLQSQQVELEKELRVLMQDADISKKQIDKDQKIVKDLEDDIKLKENALEELDKKLNGLKEEKKQLEINIEEQSKMLCKKEGDMTSLKVELKEVLEREKMSYDKLESMRKDLQLESSENAKLVEVIEYTRKDKQTLEEELDQYKQEIVDLHAKIKILENDIELEKTKLQTVIDAKTTLEKANDDLKIQNEKQTDDFNHLLEEEKKQNQELTEELDQLKKEKCNLEDKNKSLHGQTGGKTKQIKDLQQEIKTLKGKLTTATKQKTLFEEEVSDLEKDLKAAQADIETMKKDRNELCELKEIAEKKEKLTTAAQEEQRQVFEEAMNTYKVNYDKIVEDKCAIIDELKKEVSNQTTAKKDEENKRKTLEDEIGDLKKKMEDVESSKKTLEDDVDKKEEKITSLENQLKEKDEEINKLIADTKKVEEKLIEAEKAAKTAAEKKHQSPTQKTQEKHQSPTPKTQKNVSKVAPRTPVTPTVNTKMQDHPKTPRTPINRCKPSDNIGSKNIRTPLTVKVMTPRTTPQRSILKQHNSARLKRNVAFADDDEMEDDGASSDSSTSQLMEFELEEVEHRLKHNNTDRRVPSRAVTPMRIKPSPQISQKPTPKGTSTEIINNIKY
ncbi:synaptonemal complex protein 1-like [Lytechinus variegatus]|uniref:synaptonemal complex protein 1-like n=1 Tax=Lytechinus variegatus TaxID=7654 RepID=UPI001BB2AD4A|nr:synaptonemal complex protein 1-like [Lytechinus variegatus]XP_041452815.1 synaptonemal complex protein 1-like [Lytechinus variegatus]XP_041452816.1 synaptonemal complex protein 1-like [Lytechinus variegatus]XP_041452817.1 synaptonemal complex protein 1-like [Lytechinus variegatus]